MIRLDDKGLAIEVSVEELECPNNCQTLFLDSGIVNFTREQLPAGIGNWVFITLFISLTKDSSNPFVRCIRLKCVGFGWVSNR